MMKQKQFQLDGNYVDYTCVRCRVRRMEERGFWGMNRWHQIAEVR
jgi:hypothetical protein